MNVKWIVGKKTFTVLAFIFAAIGFRELLFGSLLTAGLALALSVYNIRDAQNGVEVTVFELEAK